MTNKQILEDAGKWLLSDEGKAMLIIAMKEVELSNFELIKASKVKTEYLHQPFIPMLTKFAELTKARANQWIDCSVELPPVETDVLVAGIRFQCWYTTSAGLFHGKWMSQETERDLMFDVTHWQHLPLPPNAQQERN